MAHATLDTLNPEDARRTFEVDVLRCPSFSGRGRVVGEITEPRVVPLLLESLTMPTGAPRATRAPALAAATRREEKDLA